MGHADQQNRFNMTKPGKPCRSWLTNQKGSIKRVQFHYEKCATAQITFKRKYFITDYAPQSTFICQCYIKSSKPVYLPTFYPPMVLGSRIRQYFTPPKFSHIWYIRQSTIACIITDTFKSTLSKREENVELTH